ncbi:hypothetical protein I7I51_05301 [Histoplasma capsulatum]|uniref:Uncharacterized protein n=1 Tax=Ajellomyces capsulatus TaxID=5037 RepID=A0A8A1M3C4_AJECA|nr:hypothetical protein I7I51_05301 [Histoplasma capsulatum]
MNKEHRLSGNTPKKLPLCVETPGLAAWSWHQNLPSTADQPPRHPQWTRHRAPQSIQAHKHRLAIRRTRWGYPGSLWTGNIIQYRRIIEALPAQSRLHTAPTVQDPETIIGTPTYPIGPNVRRIGKQTGPTCQTHAIPLPPTTIPDRNCTLGGTRGPRIG